MRKSAWIGLIFVLSIVSPALAQEDESMKGSFDVRLAWLGKGQAQNLRNDDPVYYGLGFRVNRSLHDSQRLSFSFSFDYLGTGGRPFFFGPEKRAVEVSIKNSSKKETLIGYPVINELGFLPNAGLEFDLVRIPHVNISVHSGIASLIVNRSVNIANNYVEYSLCDNPDYSSGCGIKGELLGNAGVSLRFSGHHWKKDNFIGGVDFTLFTSNTRQIAIFVGSTF